MGEVTCCGCIPIRAGVLTLAVLGLVGGGYLFISGIATFPSDLDNDPIVIKLRANNHTARYANYFVATVISLAVYYIVNGFLTVLTGILLLKGVYDRNVPYLRIWVKVNYLLLGISTALDIAISIAFIIIIPGFGALIFVLTLIIRAVVLGVTGYYIWVVNNYSQIIEGELNAGRVKAVA